jgi:hypothetical protein
MDLNKRENADVRIGNIRRELEIYYPDRIPD